jgi:hypothetical protein
MRDFHYNDDILYFIELYKLSILTFDIQVPDIEFKREKLLRKMKVSIARFSHVNHFIL